MLRADCTEASSERRVGNSPHSEIMKKILCLGLVLMLISMSSISCKKEPEEVTVAQKEEEEEFFKEELPRLEEWAEKEWEEREWVEEEPIELETTGGLKEAMAATSRAMRQLSRSVKKENWETIVDSGRKVEDLIAGRCVTLYYKQHPSGVPTQFIVIGDRFRNAIHSLVMAARASNSEGVLSNFLTVKGTCKDCHKLFRKE